MKLSKSKKANVNYLAKNFGLTRSTSLRDSKDKVAHHVTTKRRRSKESARSLMNNLDSTTTQLLLRNVLM